jgi:serine/threonine-protein kinase RsbW
LTGNPTSITLPAKAESLGAVTEFVRTAARQAHLPEHRIDKLEILVEELVMNVCRYAYPSGVTGVVTILYSIPAPGELLVEVADQGRKFNPLSLTPPDLTLDLSGRPVGGLGILLVNSLASPLTYRREHGWNRLTFGIS